MGRRQNNQLPENLPQLQNLIKRDPESYREEFLQQLQHFENTVEVFELNPEQPNKALDDLAMFMAQVAQCYPEELRDYPQKLINLLEKHNTVLENSMRMTLCQSLILLRNKNLLTPTDLLELFFRLLRCQDKALRTFLQQHIVTDIKNLNSKHKNVKLNTTLQNFMYTMLKDSNSRAAKMSVDIMIELYKKNVWNDAKTVNVVANACFSKLIKVQVAALKFFLGKDQDLDEKESDDESENEVNPRQVMMANKVNKKTRKREKRIEKVKKEVKKQQKKRSTAERFNFSALQLIHDPQGMAEKLFKQLETSTRRFEVKLMTLDVISRLIGLHDLFVFNFYPYMQRFFQPHQQEVTRILQFTAQACHELVPPDVIEPVLKTIANNFVTERNSSDVMAIGLNAIKEICARTPLALSEDLAQDLVMYKTYKERSVMKAAKSVIQLLRNLRPELLHKHDRGKLTEAAHERERLEYGQVNAKDFISGAEVLLKKPQSDVDIDSATSSDNDEWIDVHHSAVEDDADDPNEEEDEEEGDDDDKQDVQGDDDKQQNSASDKVKLAGKEQKLLLIKKVKTEQAQQVSIGRLLTDEDFKRIDIANAQKKVMFPSKGVKRPLEEDESTNNNPGGLVKLGDIENIHKKRRHDKEARLATVRAGQMDREKYGYKDRRVNIHCSKTNREKRKTKAYQMVRHKAKGKVKRSFKDKQIALRNHLLKLKKQR